MIILDTNALIWWTTAPEKLSKKSSKIIEQELKKGGILISSISIWEIYLLIKKGRLQFTIHPDNWLEKVENISGIRFVPIDNKIAVQSVNLPDFLHKDPADRIIIATALNLQTKLITSDQKILDYPHIQAVW